jgi:hypothetical protein
MDRFLVGVPLVGALVAEGDVSVEALVVLEGGGEAWLLSGEIDDTRPEAVGLGFLVAADMVGGAVKLSQKRMCMVCTCNV